MRRALWNVAVLATAALLVSVAVLSNLLLRDRALEAPEARLARLAPHWRVVLPEGPGPAPVAILLSGCDGPGDSMDFWAKELADVGWASLLLDSHIPRGLDRLQAWRLVCSGQALSGAERAGDVAVAIAALDGIEGVDSGRVVLLGASHGAWAAMEMIDRLGREAPPPGLTAWPESREAAAGRLQAAVFLYPYCGWFNRAAEGEPTHAAVPVLMVLAGADTIVSTEDCEAAAERLARAGMAVQTHTLPGVDHGFDQRLHAVFSTLEFDSKATMVAAEFVTAFLVAPPAKGTTAP